MNAPIRLAHGETANPSFIRELCIALAHRWEPERLFVIFTAYFDEADSHGGADALTMAAYLGSGRQWELMLRRLNGLQRSYGFNIFHATEFRSQTGEFAGWSIPKRMNLINDMADAISEELTEGMHITLPRAQYLAEYRNRPFPPKMQPDSHWGVCFRLLLMRLALTVKGIRGRNYLHVVVEDGHENVGAANTIFKELAEDLLADDTDLLGTVTLANKARCEPLMLADMHAHTFKISADHVRQGKPGYFNHPETAPRNRGAELTMFEATSETFEDLKNKFVARKNRKHDAYLKRKSSYEASKQGHSLPS